MLSTLVLFMHEIHKLNPLERSHGLKFGQNGRQLLLQYFRGMSYLCAADCSVP